jgi:hypothetical protein
VHAGIVLTAPKAFSSEAGNLPGRYGLTLSHVKGRLGARFRPVRAGIFTLEAGIGVQLGVARLDVEEATGGLWSFDAFEGTVGASVGIHLGFLRWMGLRIGVGADGLLNATGVKAGPGGADLVYDPGRFRIMITAELTAGL